MSILRNIVAIVGLCAAACSGSGSGSTATAGTDSTVATTSLPVFSADSAYANIRRQTDMGPRVPGSVAHAACREWLVSTLEGCSADTVIVQEGMMTDAKGRPVRLYNIMGRFNLGAPHRLLLLAHYDTRPWADEDADASNHSRPIDGANDGASGVGVILELVRLMSVQAPKTGVDVLFVDYEDSGISDDTPGSDLSWCLGSQYFVSHSPYGSTPPDAAILLDMVGGRDAVFRHEYFGYTAAPELAAAVWESARAANVGHRFADEQGGAVNDDHIHILGAGIPTIDIIETGHPETGGFNPTWHTMDDNIDNIDKATLDAVGRTLVHYIWNKRN